MTNIPSSRSDSSISILVPEFTEELAFLVVAVQRSLSFSFNVLLTS